MQTKIAKLLRSNQNVYTIDDLSVIWGQSKRSDTLQSARDYVKSGNLARIKRGIYAVCGRDFSQFEIANKLITPSYITGATVLAAEGMTFQWTGKIYCAAAYNKVIDLNGDKYVYSQVKKEVLFNDFGVDNKDGIIIASKERAIADLIYITKNSYSFEYLDSIKWDKLNSISKIYDSALVERTVQKLRIANAK
jgi:predicted transcriptional regulator of viral defense system